MKDLWYVVSRLNVKDVWCANYYLAQFAAHHFNQLCDTKIDCVSKNSYRDIFLSSPYAPLGSAQLTFTLRDGKKILFDECRLETIKKKVLQDLDKYYQADFQCIYFYDSVLCLSLADADALKKYFNKIMI